MTLPVVDTKSNTVSYQGSTYVFRALSEDAFTVLVEGTPVGRAVYTFGSAQGVSESPTVSEDLMTSLAEAWFAALDAER